MQNLYREELLEHYKNPQNFGKLEKYSATSRQLNPFCGDEIEMFVKFEGTSLSDISFRGQGCAISVSAASILTEFVKGKSKSALTKFSEKDMLKLLDIEISETRKKCAFLPLAVLKECIYVRKG